MWFDGPARRFVPIEQRPVGLVFQDFALFSHLDARANVAFPLEARGVGRSQRRRRADELLEQLEIGHLARAKPGRLSGGERQRVAIARALARDPQLLILDEPLSSLDPATRGRVTGELGTLLRALGLTTVIVTHSYDDAAALADWIAVIEHGAIVQTGTGEELLASPASAFVADFAGINLLTGTATAGTDGLTHVTFAGGSLVTTEPGAGPVRVAIPPWSITLESHGGSARNSLAGTIVRIVRLGNRVRVTAATPAHVTAEITTAAADELALRPGQAVTMRFKAAECGSSPVRVGRRRRERRRQRHKSGCARVPPSVSAAPGPYATSRAPSQADRSSIAWTTAASEPSGRPARARRPARAASATAGRTSRRCAR